MSDFIKQNLTYKYRIYPNATQEAALRRQLAMGWRIWNDALQMRKDAYEQRGEAISLYDLRDYWCELRHHHEELAILPSATVDALCRRLDKAYKAFFRRLNGNAENAGFPKSKQRRDFTGLEFRYGAGCKFWHEKPGVGRLRIMNVGDVRLHYHRPVPCGSEIKQVVVKLERDKEWYASFQLQYETVDDFQHTGPAVGIDIGMVYLLALSDGTTVDNPRWYREGQTRRRILYRQLSRRMGETDSIGRPLHISQNFRDTKQTIANYEAKIAREREYFWHNVTTWLTQTYSLIALEALTLDFMIQNKRLAMSAHDAGFNMFWQMLDYKAQRTGCKIMYVPPQYTSQRCSACGHVEAENRKAQARFRCVACGHEENADINAAKNILTLAKETAVQPVRDETQADGSYVSRKT